MPGGITKITRKQRDTALEAANAFLAANADLQASTLATAFNERNRRTKPAHLLGLPGELRNKIFKLALVDDAKITVTAQGPCQPALLRTCRQTRDEGLPFYYTDNFFALVVGDYHGTALEPFCRLRSQYRDRARSAIGSRMSVRQVGARCWKNFLAWLEASHSRQMLIPFSGGRPFEEITQEYAVLYAMTETLAHEISDLPWKRVMAVVSRMRPALIKAHAEWGHD